MKQFDLGYPPNPRGVQSWRDEPPAAEPLFHVSNSVLVAWIALVIGLLGLWRLIWLGVAALIWSL